MLLGRIGIALVGGHFQGTDQFRSCLTGLYDFVHIASLRGNVRIGEGLSKLFDLFLLEFLRIRAFRKFSSVQDLDGPLWAHHRNFGRGKGIIHVGSEVFGSHDTVGSSIGFACDDGNLGDGRLGKGIEKFGPGSDDTSMLLPDSRQKPGHVFEGDQRNVETVTEANEAGRLYGRVNVQGSG